MESSSFLSLLSSLLFLLAPLRPAMTIDADKGSIVISPYRTMLIIRYGQRALSEGVKATVRYGQRVLSRGAKATVRASNVSCLHRS